MYHVYCALILSFLHVTYHHVIFILPSCSKTWSVFLCMAPTVVCCPTPPPPSCALPGHSGLTSGGSHSLGAITPSLSPISRPGRHCRKHLSSLIATKCPESAQRGRHNKQHGSPVHRRQHKLLTCYSYLLLWPRTVDIGGWNTAKIHSRFFFSLLKMPCIWMVDDKFC